MNAVEIEAAVSELAAAEFDAVEFPFAFLAAFGNKETTLAKLRKGVSNSSDIPNGLLQRSNIHIAVASEGAVEAALAALKSSPKTAQAKAKFILATDGKWLEAEDLISGETIAGQFSRLADFFGFFLPLAGISTVKEIKDNPIDVRATGRLNKLYIELLKENPDWAKSERRPELNHFLARIIFCFFAEDTDIFLPGLFTKTVDQMSERDGSNTHVVLQQVFRAMNIKPLDRANTDLPNYADQFPYVNGGLFSGSAETPRFSKIARSYLLRAGELNWREINPDIFGSMIQAVADDEERGSLGMHYTSVPNILKVLNPLFLDDLREQLERAGDHKASLFKLRERMSRIRVFDPACGSGNFLVIAYKEMREIEGEINRRRGEIDRPSEIHLTNFRGIEMRDFAAEVARLALIIAEFQCDVLYRGPKLALAEFLPLNAENWIVCGNALRLDWTKICPPEGAGVSIVSTSNDLFETPLDQPRIDFTNEGGETFICGNPPYLGRKYQSNAQKDDLKRALNGRSKDVLSLDYVAGWFVLASDYLRQSAGAASFVATNSICQGIQVSALWPAIFRQEVTIAFAYPSFKWSNLASHNAGVTVSIIGLKYQSRTKPTLFRQVGTEAFQAQTVENINAYLVPSRDAFVMAVSKRPSDLAQMQFGNHPYYANALMLNADEADSLRKLFPGISKWLRPLFGSREAISEVSRYCLWIKDHEVNEALSNPAVSSAIHKVRMARLEKASDAQAAKLVSSPHRFRDQYEAKNHVLIVPIVSSENRPYLPVILRGRESIVHNKAFALYDAPLWNIALIASRLHWVWIGTVCVRLRTDFSYSNTLGWNTFPVPGLTEQNKADLTRCAEEILLARERHFPKTIADLYDPENMPDDLRRSHEANDETLERIYIGRKFKNDTERLEKLFELYGKMVATKPQTSEKKPRQKATEQLEAFADA